MRRIYIVFTLCALIMAPGCNDEGADNNKELENETVINASNTDDEVQEEITLTKMTDSKKFPDAKLQLNSPVNGAKLPPGKVSFKYTVTNYELGVQTSDAASKGIANSKDGQHIHAILNNEPYMAHYTPGFDKDLVEGHYVLLSFLSRSYHESIKNKSAMNIMAFTVGSPASPAPDLNQPHLFYSRPKGEYKGMDADKILLDFYLVNTNLSEGGNYVKATINGKEFKITEWVPYIINGLPMGENRIKLELMDSSGNWIQGPFNRVERTITLSPES